jgi:hypothetical protein
LRPRPPKRLLSEKIEEHPEVLARSDDSAAGAMYVAPLAALRPRRVAPGETAAIEIVLALQAEAVLLPESRFQVAYESQQGAVTLGAWTRTPPQAGTLHRRFRGLPVYDNTVQLQIPITVAPGTAFGRHEAQVEVRAQLHSGETGAPLLEYRSPIPCMIEVGEPLPTPAVIAATGVAAEPVHPPDPVAEPTVTATSPRESPQEDTAPSTVGSAELVAPKDDPPPTVQEPAESALPVPSDGAGLLWSVLAAFAAGLAGLAWLRLRRR